MKKIYNAPNMECVTLSATDVIATSSLGVANDISGLPGGDTEKFGSLQSIHKRA